MIQKASQHPQHVGIILDGNRRFAKRLMLEPWRGHEFGMPKVELLFEWCKKYDIKELTLYLFSLQNFNRPEKEFLYLMKLFNEGLDKIMQDKRIHENGIRVRFIGRYYLFPKPLVKKIEQLQTATAKYNKYTITVALGYGGREEITDAVQKIVADKIPANKITEKLIRTYLQQQSDPDLIIRTGGEHRTSNFLMWQSSYSEWLFMDKMWPEFDENDLKHALKDYAERKRRFGK